PQLRAFSTRRQITAAASTGIAISHGDDRDARFVVEVILAHAHPQTQALAAWIIPRNACFVHARTGRLADDEDAGGCSRAQYRPWTQRQMRFACTASADGCQQSLERQMIRVFASR